MRKSQFIELVAEKAEMSKASAARVVDAIFDTAGGAISEAVRTAGQLSIPGFGKFSSRTRSAREGRNPRTGMVIQIPERTTVSFSPGKGLRETLAETGETTRKRATKSRTAGSARKAAGGTAQARATTTTTKRAAAKKSGAAKTATASRSVTAKSAARKAGTASKTTTSVSKSTARKSGGTKSAKK